MSNRVALAELASADIRLRPAEAVAIVSEICRQYSVGLLLGIPSPGVVRLQHDGGITIEGPVSASDDEVVRAAKLLNALLPGFDAPPELRASGALRLLIARAIGSLDLPPFETLDDFTAALARFTTLDARETAAFLFAAWETARARRTVPESPAVPVVPAETTIAAVPDPADVLFAGILAESQAPAASNRWAWMIGAAALLALSAFAGWEWAEWRMDRGAEVSVTENAPAVARAAEPTSATAAPALAESSAAERTSTAGDPHVIRAAAYSPAFGRNGHALYFHEQHGGASALRVAQTGGRGDITAVSSIVDDRALNFHPRPSPDGTRIAFDSDRDGTRAVFVARADGSGVRRISGPGYAAVPSWSPDGTRIAFIRAEADKPKVWNLWVAAPDGSGLRRLTNHRVGQAWGASWFPDGQRVAYSVETRLVVLDLVTGKTRTFASPEPGHLLRTPAVSPDGSRIVFQVFHEGAWLLDLGSGRMRRVLADPTAEEYTWTPDGKRIAFHSRRSGEWSVWMMAL